MKVVILAGGLGSRLSEESHLKPKPLIEIGGKPILWHIMKIYSSYGLSDFIICCGYKGYLIKEYFSNYFLHMSDVTFDLENNNMEILHKKSEPWRVTLVDTGEKTKTGGRIKRISEHVDDTFCLTYGDGVADINLEKLISFHKKQGTLATVSAIQPAGRFGSIEISGNQVRHFLEKPKGDHRWVNGGFFVCETGIFNHIEGDATVWENDPLEGLASSHQLSVFKHDGFWGSMDTLRDKVHLEKLWDEGSAPWRKW